MKYSVSNLCIEVTRRCNMCCDHCLRGDAQNLDINTQYIDALLEGIDSIGSLTFTGGEPSLNVKAIEYTLEKCKERDISVGCFYIVTNGKTNTLPLAIASLKWYAYCDEKEICGVCISRDMFHDEISNENEEILAGLACFNNDKTTDFNRVFLIEEGRAKDLVGEFNMTDPANHNESFEVEVFDSDYTNIESMIYLAANGDIKTNCDVAYENDDYTIGNITWDNLDHLVQRYVKKNQAL